MTTSDIALPVFNILMLALALIIGVVLNTMIIPCSQSIPELHYNDAGNAFVQDHLGNWLPHLRIAQTVAQLQWPEGHMSQAHRVS